MPAVQLHKRTTYILIFVGLILLLVLFLLPFLEAWLRGSVLPEFGLEFIDDWAITPESAKANSMNATYANALDMVFQGLRIVLWMALVVGVVRFLASNLFGRSSAGSGTADSSSILKTVLSITTYIVSFFIIFQIYFPKVPLSGLFTGSTILGIVVGLALQDTLGNLFAGIAIQADQSFQAGDVLSVSNSGVGVVESVSWRGVKIRTFQNKLLVISNSELGKATLEVSPKENLNARLVFFNTLYTNSPSITSQVVLEAVRQTSNVSPKIKPIVRIRNLGDNGIDWEVKYWPIEYKQYNDTDAAIRQSIWYVFQRENIDFAFPTRTVYFEQKTEETTPQETTNARINILNSVSIFEPLSDAEIERLANASTAKIFAPGEAIVRKGQEGRSMFVIVSGSVRIQIPNRSGNKVLSELSKNSFFGEMGLLTGEPRSATAVAIEETEVLQISKEALKPIFESNPVLVQAISEIIDERKEMIQSLDTETEETDASKKAGVVNSIKQFFGLRS